MHDIEASLDKTLDKITKVELVFDTEDAGICSGYGYIHFSTEEHALTAMSKYQGKPMQKLRTNFQLQLVAGSNEALVDSFQVYVGNLPENVSDRELYDLFSKHSDHAVNVKVSRDAVGRSRGYGFVQFDSNEYAYKVANRLISPFSTGQYKLGSRTILVRETYRPTRSEIERGVDFVSNTTIFVGNLNLAISDNDLTQIFNKFGTVYSSRVVPNRGFGFVTFTDHMAALAALSEMQNCEVNHQRIHCLWGRKQDAPDESLMANIQADNQTGSYYASIVPTYAKRSDIPDEFVEQDRPTLIREALDTLPSTKRQKAVVESAKKKNEAFIQGQILYFINS